MPNVKSIVETEKNDNAIENSPKTPAPKTFPAYIVINSPERLNKIVALEDQNESFNNLYLK